MKYILRQAALTLVSFVTIYVLLGAISFVVFPNPSSGGSRDFQAAERSIYMTTPKYVFLGRSVLDSPDKKVIIVGASNAAVGFSQAIVQSKLACARVSNLAMGGANISEVKQVVDLVHEVQSEQDRKSNTFVIGVWYGMFVDSDVRYADGDRHRGETDIDIERYRYGFYRRTPDGPVAVLPPKWLDAGVVALRPLLLFEKIAREARAAVNVVLTGRKSAQRTEAEREAVVMSDQEKQKALEYWKQGMGRDSGISGGEMDALKQTIDALLASGEKVVLVNLPIPAWHRDASPYQAGYLEAMNGLLQHYDKRPNFAVMGMDDLDGNLDYSDEVHAKRHLAEVWSDRLASTLDPLVCRNNAVDSPRVTLRSSEQVKALPSN